MENCRELKELDFDRKSRSVLQPIIVDRLKNKIRIHPQMYSFEEIFYFPKNNFTQYGYNRYNFIRTMFSV